MGRIVGLVVDPSASAARYGIPTNSDLASADGVREASQPDQDLPQPLRGDEASESYETLEGSVVPLEDVNEPAAVPGRSCPKGKG